MIYGLRYGDDSLIRVPRRNDLIVVVVSCPPAYNMYCVRSSRRTKVFGIEILVNMHA